MIRSLVIVALLGGRVAAEPYAGTLGSADLVIRQDTDYRTGYLDHGGGGGLVAGIELGPVFAVELVARATANGQHLAAARVTNLPVAGLAVTTATLGVRLRVPTTGPIVPFGRLGIGYAAIMPVFVDCPSCDTVFTAGLAVEAGLGVDLAATAWLHVGAQASSQLLHFESDAFERRLRQAGSEPSMTHATITSVVCDVFAAVHF